LAKLIALDAAASDLFGLSVAVSGNTAVVGAQYDSHAGGTNAGSAYVFVRTSGVWTQQAKLTASDAAAYDSFGVSVSVSGDTAVIGAYGDNSYAGSAYVFVKPPGGWIDRTETAKLTALDAVGFDQFGWSVSVYGDTAVIGAYLNDAGGGDAGAAYVFVRSVGGWGNAWTQQAKVIASDAAAYAHFGASVSVSGDTAVVGAHAAGGVGAGSAYVFVRSGVVWAQQAKLLASDAATGDQFGFSVAVSGDTAVVGAVSDDHAGGTDAGSAYVFVKPGGGWANMMQTAKLTALDAAADDRFGFSVSLSGDTAVIGAEQDDHAGGTNAGSAYVFVKPPGGWTNTTETDKVTASDAAASDYFGQSVAVSGDTAVIGADGDDHPGVIDAGSAYVFDLNCLTPGDLDGDGDVDLADFVLFADCLVGPIAVPVGNCNGAADLNQDGYVDVRDFALFQMVFQPAFP
jgi:hypothetical protein